MRKSKIISILILLALVYTMTAMLVTGASAASTTLPEASSGGEEIDVWLIAGQSNAVGYGKVSGKDSNGNYNGYPTDSTYASYKTLLTNTSENVFLIKDDEGGVMADFQSVGFGFGKSSLHSGAEIGIATALNGNGKMNAIIKSAHGNTSLSNNTTSNESIKYGTWTPPSYIEKYSVETVGNRTGDFYYIFLNTVESGLKELRENGYTPVIRGMWWMQGEADTFSESGSLAYSELLETFISDVRRDLTEISGANQSEMPFVYGRLYRNSEYADTKHLTVVQAEQDEVAANTALKNVFMLDMRTELLDPVTGEVTTPIQHDGWHFDSFTQQMIGEGFVREVSAVTGEYTKYGVIPESEAVSTNKFVLFKKVNGAYAFDGGYTDIKPVLEEAIRLTHNSSGETDDVVILQRADHTTTTFAYGIAKFTGNITLDLGGHTLTAKTSMGNTQFADALDPDGNAAKPIFNIKNGTLLMRDWGVIFAARESTNATYTKEVTVEYNLEDLKLGFSSDASGISDTAKCVELLASDRSTLALNVTYNMNLRNCTIDMVTNTKSDAKLGKLWNTSETNTNSDYNITFEGCTFIADNVSKLAFQMNEGDSVTFKKDSSGNFAKILATAALGSMTGVGDDGDLNVSLSLTNAGTTEGGYSVYYMTPAEGISTKYGAIPMEYADAAKYPFVIFTKDESGAYTFRSDVGYSGFAKNKYYEKVMLAAVELTKASLEDPADEAVVLLRTDHVTSSYPTGVANSGTVITLDLSGYTLTAKTSLCNTGTADCLTQDGKAKNTVLNVVGGRLLMGGHGALYAAPPSAGGYSVPKEFTLNIDGVYLGFAEGATSKTLLDSAYHFPHTTNAVYNVNVINSTLDMLTNCPSGALLGRLQTSGESADACYNDHNVTIEASTLIAKDASGLVFEKSVGGDSVVLKKDGSGKYPTIYLKCGAYEPHVSTYYFEGEGELLSYVETKEISGNLKLYDLEKCVMTKYGTIGATDALNTFAVFGKDSSGKYVFSKSYNSWENAFEAAVVLADGTSDAYPEAVCLMLKDNAVPDQGVPHNAADIDGKVILDLDGKVMTIGGSFFNTTLKDGTSQTSRVHVMNGTVLTYQYGFVYTALLSGGTYTKSETFDLTFENVYLGFAENRGSSYTNLLAHNQSGSDTVNTVINMSFKNCTVDLYNNIDSTGRIGRASRTSSDKGLEDFNLKFEGCKFIVHSHDQLAYSLVSSDGDSLTFVRGEDEKYAEVLIKGGDPSDTLGAFSGSAGEELVLFYQSTDNEGYFVYSMIGPEELPTESTKYGDITYAYLNKTSYPFAVFKKVGDATEFVGGFAKYRTAMAEAISLTHVSSGTADEAVVLLRRDFEGGDYAENMANSGGIITIDLNGNTLYEKTSMGNTGVTDVLDSSGNSKKATVNIKNGNLIFRDFGIVFNAKTGSGTLTKEKVFEYNVENVNFSFAPGTTDITIGNKGMDLLISDRSANGGADTVINMNVTNCTFDLVTNAMAKARLGMLKPANDTTDNLKTKYNVVLSGCTFIANAESNLRFDMSESGDSVVYKKNSEGVYATVTLPKSAAAPAETYVISGGEGKYTVASETDTTVTYALIPKELCELDFVPRTNITLDRDLILNVYVPVSAQLKAFTLDGKDYDPASLTEKEGYYVISLPLASFEAAREIELLVKLDIGGVTGEIEGSFPVDVLTYCKALIEEGKAKNEEERQLALDVVSYIRAAYTYFRELNEASEIERVTLLVAEILGDENYDANNSPAIEGEANAASGLLGATFVLQSTPSVRFYIPEDASLSDYEFLIGGKTVSTESGRDTKGKYVDIDVYAYMAADNVTYKVNGAVGGSYGIVSYYSFVTTSDEYKNDEALINLVKRFWKYCQSAREYRDTFTEQQ